MVIQRAQDERLEEARASFCSRAVVAMRLKEVSMEAADQSSLSRELLAAARAMEELTATCYLLLRLAT